MDIWTQNKAKIGKGLLNLSPPFHLKHWGWWRLGILFAVDVVLTVAAYLGAFLLRFDTGLPAGYAAMFRETVGLVVMAHLPVFWFYGMYRELWRHANYHTALNISKATLTSSALSAAICFLWLAPATPPRSIFVIHWMLVSFLIAASRFSWRSWLAMRIALRTKKADRCFIYGAGSGGDLLARHILADDRFPYRVVGFIDDDPNKLGRRIHKFTVLGTGTQLASLCEKHFVSTVILAMPSAAGKQIRGAVHHCHEANARPLVMPDMTDSLGREVFQPREVDTRDLLRRSPKSTDLQKIQDIYRDKIVAITGAGGSIGSEICRQVAGCRPAKLVLIDSSEYNLYRIDNELADGPFGDTPRAAVLGSTANRSRMRAVFAEHRPQVILHAAADKHVPIVEANACEGIRNNVLGTLIVIEEAIRQGAERFVLISTDKAVRPTSVMGASKRICERIVQAMHEKHGEQHQLCSVRFGNVLGSSGSVIPRFLQQIQKGGPVTVTHPQMTRYFMLTSEAVGLVLQASALSKGGEIFVLNMGEPVRIYEMAQQLIRLAGKDPGTDIEIEVTGIRPGEKLYEELLLDGSEQHTLHDDVFIAMPKRVDAEQTLRDVHRLIQLAESEDDGATRHWIRELLASEVPTSAETAPRRESAVELSPL